MTFCVIKDDIKDHRKMNREHNWGSPIIKPLINICGPLRTLLKLTTALQRC